jgi:8-oxo-dGTP pyrophosphatase MutT (NUDIX family)
VQWWTILTDEYLAEMSRRFYASGAEPVAPRLAATVLLLRPPFEVYLIRRAATMAFAAGMYAFPGGAVDPRDAHTELDWVAPPNRLGLPADQARAVVCAAVREVFEETGVLLAGPSSTTMVADVSTPDWEEARRAVESREIGFAELLRSRRLVLRADLLAPWARWVTPEFEPRRYDTYFFLARLPVGQLTRHVGGEASETVWLRPDAGYGLPMLPPTRDCLEALAHCASIEAAHQATVGRTLTHPVRPTIVDGRLVF